MSQDNNDNINIEPEANSLREPLSIPGALPPYSKHREVLSFPVGS